MTRMRLAVLLALSALTALPAADAAARGRSRGKGHDRADVARLIKNVEQASDVFRRKMDDRLDKSWLDGTQREDNINEQVGELENALDRLRKRFDRDDPWRESRHEVEQVMDEARDVNRIMERARWANVLEVEWSKLRRDLNTLAGVYNIPPLSR